MSSISIYEERARRCEEQARLVTGVGDRARWLQLANEWTILSRIQFRRLPSQPHRDAFGLWRGEEIRRTDRPGGVQDSRGRS